MQGGFALHSKILSELGIDSVSVKKSSHLESIEGLIIPGGESSTISLLIESNKLFDPIKHFSQYNPVMGTCAGLIMMSKRCNDKRIRTFGLLDVNVSRNAYGRQIYSENKLVGRVVNIFGPVKQPYLAISANKGFRVTRLVGREVYRK